jgi:glycerol kinase
MTSTILAIDQGTTSSRAILFDESREIIATGQQEFAQHFPAPGWVEHAPEDLWSTTVATCRSAIERAGADAARIAAIGITNQRETTVVWDRATGRPIHNAIVWQDRRTAPACARLRDEGHEPSVTEKTGLVLDPYFSGTKVAWLLDNVEGARVRAERGELLFGTIDSYLIWRLTGGAVHATDATNASRTMLYNIRVGGWDADLCALLGGAGGDAARGPRLRRRLRCHRGRPVRPRDPDPRRRRRPAGGDGGPGVLHAGHDEIHLWHRLLRAFEYR